MARCVCEYEQAAKNNENKRHPRPRSSHCGFPNLPNEITEQYQVGTEGEVMAKHALSRRIVIAASAKSSDQK